MQSLNLKEWEQKAIKSLLQNMMLLGIVACVLTIVFEYFYPHGLDYVVTICFLIINTLGLAASIAGNEKVAFHIYILSVLALFTIMDWGYEHRYYSAFKIFALGSVFVFVVLRKNLIISLYLLLFTILECLYVYSFIQHNDNGDQLLLIYEWIHVIAYNFAFAFMCYYFINNITAHRAKIQQTEIENQQLAIQLTNKKNEALKNLLIGQEKERQRLSQDMHDGISIRLGQLKSEMNSFKGFNTKTNEQAAKIIEKLNGVQNDLRNISHALNPTLLQNFGLKKAIQEIIFQVELNDNDIALSFDCPDSLSLNEQQEKHLYYIIQELLNNAIKHGKAKKIIIRLSSKMVPTTVGDETQKINLYFFDSGKGYDLNNLNGEGIGIKNIQSRVAVLGGTFDASRKKEGMEQVVNF